MNYSNLSILVEELRSEKDGAINYLIRQIKIQGRSIINSFNLRSEEIDTILHDTIIIVIKKIQTEEYKEELESLISYSVGVCKFLGLNYLKKKKKSMLQVMKN